MAPVFDGSAERVARAWDASGDADEVAATFGVSRAWVHRLIQRRRETGSLAPRKQTKFRSRVLAGQEAATGRADHRAARCDVGGAARRPADDGGAQHAVVGNRSVGIDGQKKPYTPTNSVDLMSRPPAAGGGRRCRSTMPASTSSSMNRASPRICYAATRRSPRGTRIADHTPCGHWQTHTVVAALRPTELTATAVFDGPIDNATFLRLCRASPGAHAATGRCRRARQSRRPQTTRGPRGD